MVSIDVTKMTPKRVIELMKKLVKEGRTPHFKTRLRKHFVVYRLS